MQYSRLRLAFRQRTSWNSVYYTFEDFPFIAVKADTNWEGAFTAEMTVSSADIRRQTWKWRLRSQENISPCVWIWRSFDSAWSDAGKRTSCRSLVGACISYHFAITFRRHSLLLFSDLQIGSSVFGAALLMAFSSKGKTGSWKRLRDVRVFTTLGNFTRCWDLHSPFWRMHALLYSSLVQHFITS